LTPRAPDARLAGALAPLIRTLGSGVTEITPISKLQRHSSLLGAYRVSLADGRTLKLRLLPAPELGQRVKRILLGMDDSRFARIVGRHGRALVEEWIEGAPPADPPHAETAAEAGDLLGRLHARRSLGGLALHASAPTTAHRQHIESDLSLLVDVGRLDASTAKRLVAVAAAGDPGEAVTGIGHFDFCGENMIVDTCGRLRIIDNEHLAIGPLDFDLQRSLHRWGLPPHSRAAFLGAYAAHRGPELGAARACFWRLRSVAKSACVRVRLGHESASEPLAELARMAGERSGATPTA
jgi:aminoglycoside phosphotransferase (APT) family kinase protein